jgi:hypothetical protein
MAKQLELRRGTTQANNLFTGAAGEVTMDTDTKQLRVHDGVKAGGYALDTLVAFQAPTAGNNYTWYRKYASGWVEQGGYLTAQTISAGNSATQSLTFPITMQDTNYCVLFGSVSTPVYQSATLTDRTTTGGTVYQMNRAASASASVQFTWQVSGMAA